MRSLGKWFTELWILVLAVPLAVVILASCAGQDDGYIDYNNVLDSFPEFTPDASDDKAPTIVQSVPPDDATDLSPHLSIVLFFDDEIDPSTINSDTVRIYWVVESQEVSSQGRYGAILSMLGNTILFFVPNQPLPVEEIIFIKLSAAGVRDDGGNYIGSDEVILFRTSTEISPVETNMDFEEGESGYRFIGDGSVLVPEGELAPPWDDTMVGGISSGPRLLSDSLSIRNTTSMLATGEIEVPQGKSKLVFNYDFLSEEFDESVGGDYDDLFIMSVSGPTSLYASLVASVNIIGEDDTRSIPISDTGDIDVFGAQHTGWLNEEIDVSSMGSPINLFFTVSDVGDETSESIVFIDNIRFE